MTNFAEYSLPQLKQLQARIAKELTKRESDTKAALLKRLRRLAREEGVELEELLGTEARTTAKGKDATRRGKTSQTSATTKPPLPAKYRNPNDLTQGWSGRGRKPAWFETWVNNGGSTDALENAARSFKSRKKSAAPMPEASESAGGNIAVSISPTSDAPSAAPTDE